MCDYLRERWGERVFATEVGTSSKILEAGSAGVPVLAYAPGDRAADVYAQLAREVQSRG